MPEEAAIGFVRLPGLSPAQGVGKAFSAGTITGSSASQRTCRRHTRPEWSGSAPLHRSIGWATHLILKSQEATWKKKQKVKLNLIKYCIYQIHSKYCHLKCNQYEIVFMIHFIFFFHTRSSNLLCVSYSQHISIWTLNFHQKYFHKIYRLKKGNLHSQVFPHILKSFPINESSITS